MKAKEFAQKVSELGFDEESIRIAFGELDDSFLGYKFLDKSNCPGAPEGGSMMLLGFADGSILVAMTRDESGDSTITTLNDESDPKALTALLCLLISATGFE